MSINVKVPALEKLLDYTASGVGSIAGPMLAPWKARREAQAKLIAAKGDVEIQKALAEGQAGTMQIIAEAQAEARASLLSPDIAIQGEINLADTITQRIQFQEEKRISNTAATVRKSAQELGDEEVEDHEIDHDWTARFFNEVQDVSSEEMQLLWAKVLAGEVEQPGTTSIKTLDILKNLDRTTASLFKILCSVCVSIKLDGKHFIDARVPSLGGNAGTNALKQYGLDFGNLNLLNEHGLIISDYNSWYDIQSSVGIPLGDNRVVHIPINFQNRYWVLVAKTQRKLGKQFKLSGVALTKSGQELSKIVDIEPMQQFTLDLIKYFDKNNLNMIEVDNWQPHIMPRSSP